MKFRSANIMTNISGVLEERTWRSILAWLRGDTSSPFILFLTFFQVVGIGLAAITLIAWPWILVSIWEWIISLVVSPWARAIVIAMVTFIGFALYLARVYMRPMYGLAEIFIGIATCWASLSSASTSKLAASLAMAGGIYVMVRGFDNLIDEHSLLLLNSADEDNSSNGIHAGANA